ncbi:MAG: toll/interleukin-1 receptor domain-containing protein [Hyphomicrobium sp.]|uniref:toll/interleukin-1 receptor domain-containing protein n=1 Tax=Hyphomicrobium sp. TaxID=82 RepID=UPI003D113AED
MADIFISYCQADRMLVERLSADLQVQGWTTWWDKSLSAGEKYRDEITRELLGARAVIVLWTEASVKSDWVRAEAGRAKADAKLIPVKGPGIGYDAIPMPFGEMHTENLGNQDLIRAAILAQLTKPEVKPTRLTMAAGAVRYEFLTWLGIIGGAITLFSHLKGVIQLADWANVIVQRWSAWTHAAWAWLFSWIRLEIPPELAQFLTFFAFALSTIAGARIASMMSRDPADRGPELSGFALSKVGLLVLVPASVAEFALHRLPFGPISASVEIDFSFDPLPVLLAVVCLIGILVGGVRHWITPSRPTAGRPISRTMWFLIPLATCLTVLASAVSFKDIARDLVLDERYSTLVFLALAPLDLINACAIFAAFSVALSSDRPGAGLFVALYAPFPVIMLGVPIVEKYTAYSELTGVAQSLESIWNAWLLTIPLALCLARARRLNRRFLFMLMGLLALGALNEVSKLDLAQYF